MTDYILFEHPLNERTRTMLRLEHLFLKFDHFCRMDDSWSNRTAIDALLAIANVTNRAELKKELLQEIERQIGNLEALSHQPNVDSEALQNVLGQLNSASGILYQVNGQIGLRLREDEFLAAIMQRSSIPGGTCSFDLPIFHHWLKQSEPVRRERMDHWIDCLRPARQTIDLLLSLIRESGHSSQRVAARGMFQGSVDLQTPIQMIRIALNAEQRYFPEVSGHKNRYSIRFLEADDTTCTTRQATVDVDFTLIQCVI